MLGEHKLLHDTRKLGRVSIGKGDRDCRLWSQDWKFESWCVWLVWFYEKYLSHVREFWESKSGFVSPRIFWTEGPWWWWFFPVGVSRTQSFLLRDIIGLSCDTSGWGCRPLVSHDGQKVWCQKCFGVHVTSQRTTQGYTLYSFSVLIQFISYK